MGKERISNSYSSHHLYSPWFTSNVDPKKQYRFKQYGLFGKEEEIEDCIDEYMKQTIMQIENEHQHRISNNIDEEE
jgi:hypothetical protein